MKNIIYRLVRKTAHLSGPVAYKFAGLLGKVENKTTRLITGKNTDGTLSNESLKSVKSARFIDIKNAHLPEAASLYPALPKLGRKPSLTLLVPTLNKELFFGGIATALIAASLVAKKLNLDLRVVQTFKKGDADIAKFLSDKGLGFDGDITIEDVSDKKSKQYVSIDIHPDDIFMASAWADAYVIEKLPLKHKFIYLMQDFEPIFFPNSDQRAKAESTYRSNKYVALCNTKLMYDHLVSEGFTDIKNNGGTWFEPAVFNGKLSIENAGKRKMFIYGRPRVKRNLFITAIESVEKVFSESMLNAEEWEVFMAGQDDIPNLDIDGGVTIKNLGKMDLDSYYEFMRTVDVAISPMMAPHPNYPTLEFASTGASVVSTKYGVKQDLSFYSKNIIMSESDSSSMALALVEAANVPYKTRIKNARNSNVSSDWIKSLDKPTSDVAKKIYL